MEPTLIPTTPPLVLPQVVPTAPSVPSKRRWHRIFGPLALILATTAVTTAILHFALPPAAPVTPLANADQPEIVRQSLAEDHETLTYYLAGSQEYLKRARELSQKYGASQTDDNKREIVALLNQSLQMANNAVSYYPYSPEGYSTRATLFETISALDPSARDKAVSDRQLAAKLGKSTATDVAPTDLIKTQPLEEATLLKNVAIALPSDGSAQPIETKQEDNTEKGVAAIKAGTTSVTVSSPEVTADHLVYFTPAADLQGSVLTLSSKDTAKGTFTLSLDKALTADLSINWWIVK